MECHSKTKPLLVGLGRKERADDGVGLYVVEQVKQRLNTAVEARCFNEDTLALLEYLDPRRPAIIVDALAPQSQPGRCVQWRGQDTLPQEFRGTVSSHAMDLIGVIKLARVMGRCPQDIRLIGIEAQEISFKEGLSSPVRQAADRLIDQLVHELSGFCKSHNKDDERYMDRDHRQEKGKQGVYDARNRSGAGFGCQDQ